MLSPFVIQPLSTLLRAPNLRVELEDSVDIPAISILLFSLGLSERHVGLWDEYQREVKTLSTSQQEAINQSDDMLMNLYNMDFERFAMDLERQVFAYLREMHR
jgi:hypothetical protein